jgi:hypothetical protein
MSFIEPAVSTAWSRSVSIFAEIVSTELPERASLHPQPEFLHAGFGHLEARRQRHDDQAAGRLAREEISKLARTRASLPAHRQLLPHRPRVRVVVPGPAPRCSTGSIAGASAACGRYCSRSRPRATIHRRSPCSKQLDPRPSLGRPIGGSEHPSVFNRLMLSRRRSPSGSSDDRSAASWCPRRRTTLHVKLQPRHRPVQAKEISKSIRWQVSFLPDYISTITPCCCERSTADCQLNRCL